ncbi:MAG: helix-turn-helix domain-containing protein [Clostridia bacterium]|nr:helix-turn-helix domain-containing protein [Clostridia bacterium]
MESIFGERLKASMEARGVNMAWLATETETAPSSLSRYCSGYTYPESLNTVAKIAKVLNVSVDYLVGATDVMTPAPSISKEVSEFEEQYSHHFSNPDFQVYVGVYANLSPKARGFLVELVRAYGMNQNVVAEDGVTILPNQYNK